MGRFEHTYQKRKNIEYTKIQSIDSMLRRPKWKNVCPTILISSMFHVCTQTHTHCFFSLFLATPTHPHTHTLAQSLNPVLKIDPFNILDRRQCYCSVIKYTHIKLFTAAARAQNSIIKDNRISKSRQLFGKYGIYFITWFIYL